MIGFQPGADLALLQLDVVPRDAPVVSLADSDSVEVGDPSSLLALRTGSPTP
jgi:S1-C subfamily serine protease